MSYFFYLQIDTTRFFSDVNLLHKFMGYICLMSQIFLWWVEMVLISGFPTHKVRNMCILGFKWLLQRPADEPHIFFHLT